MNDLKRKTENVDNLKNYSDKRLKVSNVTDDNDEMEEGELGESNYQSKLDKTFYKFDNNNNLSSNSDYLKKRLSNYPDSSSRSVLPLHNKENGNKIMSSSSSSSIPISNGNGNGIPIVKKKEIIKPSIDEKLIIDQEDEKQKELRLIEESRLRRQKIMEKYEEEQQQQQQQQPQPQPQQNYKDLNQSDDGLYNIDIQNIQAQRDKEQIDREEEEESMLFEWRKDDSENKINNNTSNINNNEEDEHCSSEEDLKKRGKINAEDIKHKPTVTITKIEESTKPSTTTTSSSVKQESTSKKPQVDMFDMFSDSPSADTAITLNTTTAAVSSTGNIITLTDNWDDEDGYYKFKLGEIMDKYQIFSPLGSGVFSSVVSAKNTKTDEDVVVKIIRNRPSMNRSGLKEIEILTKINNNTSPNQKTHCIQFKDSFTFKNHLCLVFEQMSMSLSQLIKKYGKNIGLSLNAVRVYAKQLFIALKHIKNCKILHSDIKPDNIVVNESKNTIKLVDFGSAGEPHESEITPYLVSRFYRAPEIILGNKYDYAIDIWSVGCCLAELYTGRFLFPGKTNNDMIKLFLEYKGPFPKKLLKKAKFLSKHFNDNLIFMRHDRDKSGEVILTPCDISKPTKDILSFLNASANSNSNDNSENQSKLLQLKDLIEKCTILDPEKRITPQEALNHPFLKPN
ncbi:putative protein serine/threonine kinase [Tieghemostelium lacteum]|uniref:non-specific serine/threonine protein kinase n=1 Tax=Tieghemostelium lacteum TaxID=361077 RepID=A0A151Z5L6_TIELA|nr:putative protein serine/threonine kinase [Tieghemostelium lacteum]|eukprot:KYQ89260.1 putative protein serine/threonine kinase [Tieghemostelium lacteum]